MQVMNTKEALSRVTGGVALDQGPIELLIRAGIEMAKNGEVSSETQNKLSMTFGNGKTAKNA